MAAQTTSSRPRRRRRRPSTVTIHDVAARAGVSVATVSRVLNRNAPVRQETLERQRKLLVTLSPREITQMADAYARSHTLMVVTEGDVRRLLGSNRLFAWLAAYRRPAGRVLRRWGWIK